MPEHEGEEISLPYMYAKIYFDLPQVLPLVYVCVCWGGGGGLETGGMTTRLALSLFTHLSPGPHPVA